MAHTHTISNRRIEAFSDGVFAIVVTLLVLDLKVPELPDGVSIADTLTMLQHLIPQFLSFFLSFFIVCIFWVNHHQFFHVLKKSDRKLLWLNNFLLFWLCFVPFPTAFIGRYPTNVVAIVLFGVALFLAASSFSLMTYHALFKGKLVDVHVSRQERVKSQRRSYWGVGLYGIAALIAPLLPYVSIGIYVIVPLLYFSPRKITFTEQ